jgi:hypothetical protein
MSEPKTDKVKVTVVSNDDPFELDIKRCYLPVVLKATCPACGVEVEMDLNGDEYLSYPYINGRERVGMSHEIDDGEYHEFEVFITLRLTVEEAVDND